MELRQLRSLITLVDSGFNVSRAAEQLHVVQSAVSQHLKTLETELGAPLLKRHGKRVLGLTDLGERVQTHARRALAELGSINAAGQDLRDQSRGVLRLATTHTQARYVLPPVIRRFRADFPDVALQIHQGTPLQLVDMVNDDRVDLAICTEALADNRNLITLPCYRWNRCLIAPHGHEILARRPISLETLCEFPLVTYVFGFTGRGSLSDAFARVGLSPQVVCSAADTDIIKTYVREGLGVGIIATLAFDAKADSDLDIRELDHLFPWEVTKIAYLRDRYLRQYHEHFIDCFRRQVWADPRLAVVGRG